MGFPWNIRKYEPEDDEGIAELLNIVFGKWHSLEYWRARIEKHKRNPAGSPIIWLAEHNNKVIGHYGIIPITMKVGNSYMTGSYSCYGATHPKYQGKGVFSSLVNKCYLDAAQNGIPLTFGFANINLEPTYIRYEWRGHICYVVDMLKVLDWESLLGRYLRTNFLIRVAAPVLGQIRASGSANMSLKIERISRFDERINRFWEGISKHFETAVKKDQKYLNWKYVEYDKYAIYLAVKDHRILGYCVLGEEQNGNLIYGSIVDILGLTGNVVSCLIERALEFFKRKHVVGVRCHLAEKHPYKAIFKKAGFLANPIHYAALFAAINLYGSSIDERKAYSQALTLSQNPLFKEKRNWFVVRGDGD